MITGLRIGSGVLVLVLLLTGCGQPGDRREIPVIRPVDNNAPPPVIAASVQERFGFEPSSLTPGDEAMPAAHDENTNPPAAPSAPALSASASPASSASPAAAAQDAPVKDWTLPEGWKPLPDRPMRLATFQAGASPEVECSITVLRNEGGGLEPNINRWREQMGQEPLAADAIAALPVLTVLGAASPLVEITGAYTGMSGEAKPGCRMAAVACLVKGSGVFIKMVGPDAAVQGEMDRFRAFCESLR